MAYHQGNLETNDAVLLATMDEDDYSAGLADASGNGHTGTNMGANPIMDPATPPKPANGTLDIHDDGTVTYTPNPGFSGIDSFEYTVEDNSGTVSNVATVTITVSPPTSLLAGEQQTISKQAIKGLEGNNPSILSVPITSIPSESISSRTVYEDAEDGGIKGWHVYGDGRVVNQEDRSGNRIISIEGNINSDPFRLGLNDGSDWNNTTDFTAYFAMLLEDEAAVYFRVDTTAGEKYLCYTSSTEIFDSKEGIILFGLGIEADGQWHGVYRDLAADLSTALPSAQLFSVKDIYIYGSAKIDDIMLLDGVH